MMMLRRSSGPNRANGNVRGKRMRPTILQLCIGLILLLVIAVGLKNFRSLASTSQEPGVFIVQPSTSIERFEPYWHSCGGPHHSWVTGYFAYDGKRLSFSSETYKSLSEAGRSLQNQLQNAARVQEVGVKYNQEGQIIGERAVAYLIVDGKEIATII